MARYERKWPGGDLQPSIPLPRAFQQPKVPMVRVDPVALGMGLCKRKREEPKPQPKPRPAPAQAPSIVISFREGRAVELQGLEVPGLPHKIFLYIQSAVLFCFKSLLHAAKM